MKNKVFNVRVYALVFSREGAILASDEFRYGHLITKFPGGGLEFGEGLIECLQRECMEELGQAVSVKEHFYTTDFFQVSAFDENQQVLSVYYLAEPEEPVIKKISMQKFDFPEMKEGAQSFRWIMPGKIAPAEFTFPIDKMVASLIRERISGGQTFTGKFPM